MSGAQMSQAFSGNIFIFHFFVSGNWVTWSTFSQTRVPNASDETCKPQTMVPEIYIWVVLICWSISLPNIYLFYWICHVYAIHRNNFIIIHATGFLCIKRLQLILTTAPKIMNYSLWVSKFRGPDCCVRWNQASLFVVFSRIKFT